MLADFLSNFIAVFSSKLVTKCLGLYFPPPLTHVDTLHGENNSLQNIKSIKNTGAYLQAVTQKGS